MDVLLFAIVAVPSVRVRLFTWGEADSTARLQLVYAGRRCFVVASARSAGVTGFDSSVTV